MWESEEDQASEDQGYEKVDKRHSAAEEASEEPATGPAPEQEETAEEPGDEETPAMSLADLEVYDVLRFSLGLFVQQAWIHLGIQKAPGAEDVKTDLEQAKVAIETIRALAAQLEGHVEEGEQREMQAIISNLQINFVQRSE